MPMMGGLGELGSVECHGAVMGITQPEVGCALPCQSIPGVFLVDALRRLACPLEHEDHCPSSVQLLGNNFNLRHFGFGKGILSES